MRCIVTGGAGFIGSHVVDSLLDDGHDVVVIDSFVNGRRSNLAHRGDDRRLAVHDVDIRDAQALVPLFAGADWVFHLAALADIVPSIRQPADYFTTNVDGTFNVLEAARGAAVKRFLYAASSSCYGIPDAYPTPETAEIRPEYPYALTKYMGECLVMHWGKVYHLSTVSLRLFNVYGPRSRTTGAYGAVFGVFLAQKLAGKPFTVVGDGTQTRDFTFVTDVAGAFATVAGSGVSSEIFNVGSGGHYSVNHLIGLIGGTKTHIPKRPAEPNCTFADVSKIARVLDWKASVPFEEGVRRVLARIEDWRDAPVWTPSSIAQATEDWFKTLGRSAERRP